jgi:hypothetical protein
VLSADTIMLSLNKDFIIIIIIRKLSHESWFQKIWHPPQKFLECAPLFVSTIFNFDLEFSLELFEWLLSFCTDAYEEITYLCQF